MEMDLDGLNKENQILEGKIEIEHCKNMNKEVHVQQICFGHYRLQVRKGISVENEKIEQEELGDCLIKETIYARIRRQNM